MTRVSYLDRAKAAAKDGVAAMKRMMPERSSDELYEKRMAICRECPFHRDLPGGGLQCMKCGCIMNVKARFKGASCPIGKW